MCSPDHGLPITRMFVFGTYLGILVALLIVAVIVRCAFWQRRFGGFWPYLMLIALFLIPVACCTVVETTALRSKYLEQTFTQSRSDDASIDELRQRMVARNNSMMVMVNGFFLALTILLGAFTTLKAARLNKIRDGLSA